MYSPRSFSRISTLGLGFAIVALTLLGCTSNERSGVQAEEENAQTSVATSVAGQSSNISFGQYYQPTEVKFIPDAPGYQLPLDLSALANPDMLRRLSPPTQALLQQNGFVVTAAGGKEDMAEVYDDIEEADIPVYVTADSLLHVYHIQFDETLKDIEEREFFGDLMALGEELMTDSHIKYKTFTGDLKEAARRNLAFFTVGWWLMQPDTVAYQLSNEVEEGAGELALIEAHQGFASSPLFHYREDYSQYVPRGHYTRSEELKKYFKAMMWYGRMAFLLKGTDLDPQALVSEEDARIQTLQACLIAQRLYGPDQEPDLAAIWNRIYQVTAFYVGLADDLTPYEYAKAIKKVYGTAFAWKELAQPSKLRELKGHLASLHSPQIYGGTGDIVITPPFSDEDLAENLDKTKGLRLMGQRFIPDSYMFQQLVFPSTGLYTGRITGQMPFTLAQSAGGPIRGFPRGLDVMSVMGSQRAGDILEEASDTQYERYDEKLAELKEMFDAFTPAEWNRNLYWSWLYALQALIQEREEGYPSFMRTEAWQDRQLNAALASWAELRHDTILYAKQSYTMGLTAMPPPRQEPPPGYVEPVPEFSAHGLGEMEVLDETATLRLQALASVLRQLRDIAVKELSNQPLTDEEYNFIRHFGSSLDRLTAGTEQVASKTSLIADVHTDSNTRQVLEEAVGYVDRITVAYQLPDGRIAAGQGPVFSYYEFKQPMADRLTDEAWREMLQQRQAPAPPEWTASFRAQ